MIAISYGTTLINPDNETLTIRRNLDGEGWLLCLAGEEFWIDDITGFAEAIKTIALCDEAPQGAGG